MDQTGRWIFGVSLDLHKWITFVFFILLNPAFVSLTGTSVSAPGITEVL